MRNDRKKVCPFLSKALDNGELKKFYCLEKECAIWIPKAKICGLISRLKSGKEAQTHIFNKRELEFRKEEYERQKFLKESRKTKPDDFKEMIVNENGGIVLIKKEQELSLESNEKRRR